MTFTQIVKDPDPPATLLIDAPAPQISAGTKLITTLGFNNLIDILDGVGTDKISINALADNVIVNAKISTSAGIAVSKLAAGTEGYILKTVAGIPSWATPPTSFSGNLSDLTINTAKNWAGFGISNLGDVDIADGKKLTIGSTLGVTIGDGLASDKKLITVNRGDSNFVMYYHSLNGTFKFGSEGYEAMNGAGKIQVGTDGTSNLELASDYPNAWINYGAGPGWSFDLKHSAVSRLSLNNSSTVFNVTGASLDFRVASVGKPNTLFVRGSDGLTGLNTGLPEAILHIANANSPIYKGNGIAENIQLFEVDKGDVLGSGPQMYWDVGGRFMINTPLNINNRLGFGSAGSGLAIQPGSDGGLAFYNGGGTSSMEYGNNYFRLFVPLTQEIGGGINEQTLTAQKNMSISDAKFQKLSTNGAGYDVLLPPEKVGLWYVISNMDATQTLTIKEDSDTTTIATLGPLKQALFICSSTVWKHMGISVITAS